MCASHVVETIPPADEADDDSLRPTPWLIEGRLDQQDQQAVFTWVSRNADALVAYWDGQIDTAQLIPTLKPLS